MAAFRPGLPERRMHPPEHSPDRAADNAAADHKTKYDLSGGESPL